MAKNKNEIQFESKRRLWKQHIKLWQKSNKTQAEYCRVNNLSLKSFWYWKKKYKSAPSFVPVKIKTDIFPSSPIINLIVDSRFRIEINKTFEPETLKSVLQVLNQI